MMNLLLLRTLCAVCVFRLDADARTVGDENLVSQAIQYFTGTLKDIPMNIINPPKNEKGSVEYRVYTRKNPTHYCFLEPNKQALKRCKIDPQDKLILLIHGFITQLAPGNVFEVMKDKILANGPFTVIILDWTKYNGPPYTQAVENMKLVSTLAADMLKYLIKYAGVRADNMIIAGHSLGGHMAGYIGRRIPNLGRIDSLDPAWPYFTSVPFLSKVSFSDANFVKVIHTSSELGGLGTKEALGHMDFYVNGGSKQPHCKFGAQFKHTSGDVVTINSEALKHICIHEIVCIYYIETMNKTDCRFLATKCDSYQDFKNGKCPPSTSEIGDMGFYGERIVGLPPKSKFYFRTRKNPPYCLNDGFKPLKPKTIKNV